MSILYSKSSLAKWIPYWDILVVKFQAISFLIIKVSLTKTTVRLEYTQLTRLKKSVCYDFKIVMNGMKLPFTILRWFSLLFTDIERYYKCWRYVVYITSRNEYKTHSVLFTQHLSEALVYTHTMHHIDMYFFVISEYLKVQFP